MPNKHGVDHRGQDLGPGVAEGRRGGRGPASQRTRKQRKPDAAGVRGHVRGVGEQDQRAADQAPTASATAIPTVIASTAPQPPPVPPGQREHVPVPGTHRCYPSHPCPVPCPCQVRPAIPARALHQSLPSRSGRRRPFAGQRGSRRHAGVAVALSRSLRPVVAARFARIPPVVRAARRRG